MTVRGTYAVAARNLGSFARDPRALVFLILFPLVVMSLFGYTFQNGIRNVPVCVIDLDAGSANGSVADAIIADISTRDIVSLDPSTGPLTSVLGDVEDGSYRAVIVFGPNFTADMATAVANARLGLPATPATVVLYVDSANPTIGRLVAAEVQKSIQIVLASQYHVTLPVAVLTNAVYGGETTDFDFTVPGIMGLVAMMAGFMPAMLAFIAERSGPGREGAPRRSPSELVGGYALSYGAIAIVQSSVILGTMMLFSVQVEGSAWLVLLTLVLLMTSAQGLGILIGSMVGRDPKGAVQSVPLVLFPSIILTGLIFPVEMVPDLLRPLSYLLPLTYSIDSCRDIMIRGWGIGDVWLDVVALAVFTAAALAVSVFVLWRRGSLPAEK
jgi:ABC-2 type transport system permease protein